MRYHLPGTEWLNVCSRASGSVRTVSVCAKITRAVIVSFATTGKDVAGQAQGLDQIPGPLRPGHVEQGRARGVAFLGAQGSGQRIAHIILGQHEPRHLPEHVRGIVFQPHQLGRGKALQGRVQGCAQVA